MTVILSGDTVDLVRVSLLDTGCSTVTVQLQCIEAYRMSHLLVTNKQQCNFPTLQNMLAKMMSDVYIIAYITNHYCADVGPITPASFTHHSLALLFSLAMTPALKPSIFLAQVFYLVGKKRQQRPIIVS